MNSKYSLSIPVSAVAVLALVCGQLISVDCVVACQTQEVQETSKQDEQASADSMQFRLAESTGSDGLQEMAVAGSEGQIFVHPEVLLDARHIESVDIRQNATSGNEGLHVRLTEAGGKRLEQVTSENSGKMLAVILNGKVIVAPRIRNKISREMVLEGNFSRTELEAMASALRPGKTLATAVNKKYLEELNDVLSKLHEDKRLSGAVLVCRNGEDLFEKSYGYSNIEKELPLSTRSSFRLASVSKQFTAMCVMMLAEDGKLDYDDDISRFLPELPYKGITIRHLLNHTGGLPDYMAVFAKHWDKDKEFSEKKMAFNEDVVSLFAEHQPAVEFSPGDRYSYSNTGYVMLGNIISRASKETVNDFIQKRIFDELQMQDSGVFSEGNDFELPERVFGFAWRNDGTHVPFDWHFLNGMVGDGGIYASADDLRKWDLALKTEVLVKKSTLDAAFTPGKLNDGTEIEYGFGWQVKRRESGGITVSHGGGWVGFRTLIVRDLESDVTFVMLTNNSFTAFSEVTPFLMKLGIEQ